MSIIKINRQDTQHFRDKSTHFVFSFYGLSLSNLNHALPLPSSRGCCDDVLGGSHQDTECCSKTRVSPSQAAPAAATTLQSNHSMHCLQKPCCVKRVEGDLLHTTQLSLRLCLQEKEEGSKVRREKGERDLQVLKDQYPL